MRRSSWIAASLVPWMCGWLYGQNAETSPKKGYGYAFSAPGVWLGDGTAENTLTIGAGAEGLIKGGLGAGADLSYLFFPRFPAGFGLVSPGVFYQFNPRRTTGPFVACGYSLDFRPGTTNLIHFGGGVNHWFSNRWGMRFEVRDHMQTRSAIDHQLQFRMAFLFH